MDFAEVARWLDDRLSQPVQVTVSGPSDSRGNSGAALSGALGPGLRDSGLMNSRGGALKQWSVGQAGAFFVLEGDFVAAELLDEDDPDDGLLIETREVTIIVAMGE